MELIISVSNKYCIRGSNIIKLHMCMFTIKLIVCIYAHTILQTDYTKCTICTSNVNRI